ncbi:MAG: nhaA [Rhodospirillales bacterium]|jgi:NhaA family Na+:H+ antiporter|nr:nhaA [Rhodospirillales bacterium]
MVDEVGVRKLGPRAAFMRAFLDNQAAAGLVLMAASALALVIANIEAGGIATGYRAIWGAYLGPMSLGHWVNDGLMALFFLLVGLEIKRELLDGELSDWSKRVLPGLAAAGGMAAPALVYVAVSWSDPGALRGWAVPAATDIAFALGVLALLGPKAAPPGLRTFLAALAIIDDLGAVLIIAVFYTAALSLPALAGAALVLALLAALNRAGVDRLWPYLVLGAVLWVLVLASGVHATLAGVALAFCIPLATRKGAPLLRLEHGIAPWVNFLVVPVFGFANAGVALGGAGMGTVGLAVGAGLFLGKQAGVMGACWIAVRSGLARLPEGAGWLQLYGVALLCGIGFTMSLFIGLLAFPGDVARQEAVKLGVLAGSLASAVAGAGVLRWSARRRG